MSMIGNTGSLMINQYIKNLNNVFNDVLSNEGRIFTHEINHEIKSKLIRLEKSELKRNLNDIVKLLVEAIRDSGHIPSWLLVWIGNTETTLRAKIIDLSLTGNRMVSKDYEQVSNDCLQVKDLMNAKYFELIKKLAQDSKLRIAMRTMLQGQRGATFFRNVPVGILKSIGTFSVDPSVWSPSEVDDLVEDILGKVNPGPA